MVIIILTPWMGPISPLFVRLRLDGPTLRRLVDLAVDVSVCLVGYRHSAGRWPAKEIMATISQCQEQDGHRSKDHEGDM